MFSWLRSIFATQPLRVDQVAADAEQFRREQDRITRMRKWRSGVRINPDPVHPKPPAPPGPPPIAMPRVYIPPLMPARAPVAPRPIQLAPHIDDTDDAIAAGVLIGSLISSGSSKAANDPEVTASPEVKSGGGGDFGGGGASGSWDSGSDTSSSDTSSSSDSSSSSSSSND